MDIQGGQAVRLMLGDPDRETVYDASPVAAGLRWEREGAGTLHVVDLDAATGRGENRAAIKTLLAGVGVPVEVGGGLRSLEVVQEVLAMGAARAVIGSVAVTNPPMLDVMLQECGPGAIIVSLDARAGLVATHGWRETSGERAVSVAERVWAQGVRTLIYTDVTRDGTLAGLDPGPLESIRAAWPGRLVVGGGIANLQDLELLDGLGIEAAIAGRALYEGTLNLRDALNRI